MKITDESNEKVYVDPILIKEGFFSDEEDYIRTMDKVFKGLREVAVKEKDRKRTSKKQLGKP